MTSWPGNCRPPLQPAQGRPHPGGGRHETARETARAQPHLSFIAELLGIRHIVLDQEGNIVTDDSGCVSESRTPAGTDLVAAGVVVDDPADFGDFMAEYLCYKASPHALKSAGIRLYRLRQAVRYPGRRVSQTQPGRGGADDRLLLPGTDRTGRTDIKGTRLPLDGGEWLRPGRTHRAAGGTAPSRDLQP
jgi:hypothetical protein